MKDKIIKQHYGTDPKETTPTTEVVEEQENESTTRNDKRYEEPFENDGAYADDDIDEPEYDRISQI